LAVIALKNILVATDFSESSAAALQYGIELARKYDAALHLLHVVDDVAARSGPLPGLPSDAGGLQTALEDSARANLASLLPEATRDRLATHMHVTVSSSPGDAILSYARDAQIDLVIVGTHGRRGLPHVFFGSVAQHVSRLADCPVLTVRAHERDFIKADVAPVSTLASVWRI
jgi:nucleotide-binding universal stress UspA family protein